MGQSAIILYIIHTYSQNYRLNHDYTGHFNGKSGQLLCFIEGTHYVIKDH